MLSTEGSFLFYAVGKWFDSQNTWAAQPSSALRNVKVGKIGGGGAERRDGGGKKKGEGEGEKKGRRRELEKRGEEKELGREALNLVLIQWSQKAILKLTGLSALFDSLIVPVFLGRAFLIFGALILGFLVSSTFLFFACALPIQEDRMVSLDMQCLEVLRFNADSSRQPHASYLEPSSKFGLELRRHFSPVFFGFWDQNLPFLLRNAFLVSLWNAKIILAFPGQLQLKILPQRVEPRSSKANFYALKLGKHIQ